MLDPSDFLNMVRLKYVPALVLFGIVLGVIGKYFYDYAVRYFKAKNKKSVTWDGEGFLITVGLSVIVAFLLYGYAFDRVAKAPDEMFAFAIAFQIGFFSQSIIGELGKRFNE